MFSSYFIISLIYVLPIPASLAQHRVIQPHLPLSDIHAYITRSSANTNHALQSASLPFYINIRDTNQGLQIAGVFNNGTLKHINISEGLQYSGEHLGKYPRWANAVPTSRIAVPTSRIAGCIAQGHGQIPRSDFKPRESDRQLMRGEQTQRVETDNLQCLTICSGEISDTFLLGSVCLTNGIA